MILCTKEYGHTKAKSLTVCGPNSNPNSNKCLGRGYKGLVFCMNSVLIMENMDKGLTIPKKVLINWVKIPQMPQNLSAQIVGLSPQFWDFDEKNASLASVVHAMT